jgi:formamidopyrimidine-DNA glycosylase
VPELPEVQALTAALSARMTGLPIDRYQMVSFSALKTVTPSLDDLVGPVVEGVERRGKFVCLAVGGLWLIVHLARGGWIRWYDTVPATRLRPGRSPIALRIHLDDGSGFDVTEGGTEKRVSLWVVPSPGDVPAVARLGVDPLGPEFTVEGLAELLGSASSTLKTALTTQSLIAGVGNAYSDEALHRARLSPFARTRGLGADQVAALHAAVTGVLAEAVERTSGLDPGRLKGDKKEAMAVHGRTGLACPVCGDTVRQVSYATSSLQYCPTCQTGGRTLADRRLSRLLK